MLILDIFVYDEPQLVPFQPWIFYDRKEMEKSQSENEISITMTQTFLTKQHPSCFCI